jgi:arylsulfatase A-like enzyme
MKENGQNASSLKEYKQGAAFPGVIGRTFDQSRPAWPMPNRAKENAPNVLFIVQDDTGFGQLGCYGSPIKTPNLDLLAKNGLLFTGMHTTALCSPTRSCILTGRNHHSNGLACITEGSTGYPGGNGYIPFENGFLSEILLQHGYNTYAIGKWHLTPAEQNSAAGPYDRWPLGRGFERYFGFLGGDTHQYYPELVYDNHQVEPEKTPEEGYHLTEDLVDKAKGFIADAKQIAPDKPFFMYFCPGAMHAPHHVTKEWSDKYKGKFDDGWDAYREVVFANQKKLGILPKDAVLSRHDPDVQDWNSLSPEEKALYAKMMEVFAGFLEHTDHQYGRLFDFLKEIDEWDNTLIMFISDNGASAEGGPTGSVNENKFFNNIPEDLEQNLKAIDDIGGPKYFNHYPWGWTFAGNTPFRRWKRETYRGGVSDPFLVHWPKGIEAKGEIRNQFAHAIDMLPTVLDALKIEAPLAIKGVTQSPVQGHSFAHLFDNANAESNHEVQYFEMMGHRSIYWKGWRAVCPWPGQSFVESGLPFGAPIDAAKLTELDANNWELYDLTKDPTESNNIAKENRAKLIEMIAQWYVEAGKYNVLPVDSRGTLRFADPRPQIARARKTYTYYPGTQVVPGNAAVNVMNKSFSIIADVEIPRDGVQGVLYAMGGNDGGLSLFIKDSKLTYVYNYAAAEYFSVSSDVNVSEGRHELRMEFEATGKAEMLNGKGAPGIARLYIDDKPVGETEIPYTLPLSMGLGSGGSVGADPGSPTTPEYKPPFRFTGKIHTVVIDVSGERTEGDEKAMEEASVKTIMARQ